MTPERTPHPEFQSFLALLHQDPRQAECEYYRLRRKLVCFFRQWGRRDLDALADDVILRAYRKWLEGELVETPTRYCYGIARNLLKETSAPPVHIDLPEDLKAPWVDPERVVLLGQLLAKLPLRDRELIVAYYTEDRKEQAQRLGVSENALRIRAYRIHEQLRSLADSPPGGALQGGWLK